MGDRIREASNFILVKWRTGALALCILCSAGLLRSWPVHAAEGEAAAMLAEADNALLSGEKESARATYERIVREHPESPEAMAAKRALAIMKALKPESGTEGPTEPVEESKPDESPGGEKRIVIFRKEPYSLLTQEKVRLSTWEKIDFGVTAFTYGMSLGVSYSVASDPQDSGTAMGPIVFAATVYTFGSIAYLEYARPDRGDLPLVLGITSYLPTTALLVSQLPKDAPSSEETGVITALSGTLAVPIALKAASVYDFDPGDAQLVRDAGFWGLVLGLTGVLGFGGHMDRERRYPVYEEPSGSAIALGGLGGLYGGLGLGLLAARYTEPSLERIRITTWGGYGGGLLGALMSASVGDESDDEQIVWRGITFGAVGGMSLAYVLSRRVDAIPPETPFIGADSTARFLAIPTVRPDGSVVWTVGVAWGG